MFGGAYEMSFICFFEYVTLHTPSHHHRSDLVHVEEFSMTFPDRHEAGLHEGLVNISLNGQAFRTHAWRLRKSSFSSLHWPHTLLRCTLKAVVEDRLALLSNMAWLWILRRLATTSVCGCIYDEIDVDCLVTAELEHSKLRVSTLASQQDSSC